MEYWFFCGLLLALFLYGMRFEKVDGSQKDMLERFNNLRGIFALLIVIGHCSMRFEKEVLPFLLIHKFNMTGVCFFLFISGWGLTYGYLEREKKTDGFIRRKIVSLLLISFISSLIYYILNEMILYGNRNLLPICKFVLKNTNWYIWEIVFFYIIFYFCVRLNCKKCFVSILFAAAILICAAALALNWERAFWFSAFSFPFGAFVSRFWDKINNSFRKYKWLPISVLCIGAVSTFSVILPQDTVLGCIARNFFGIMAMSILWIVSNYVKIENRFLEFLKGISLEIYLYQFTVMTALKIIFERYELALNLYYVISVLIVLILICVVISRFDFVVKEKLCGNYFTIGRKR